MATFAYRSKGMLGGEVEVDGVDVSRAVSAVRITHEVGKIATVELDLPVVEMETSTPENTKVYVAAGVHHLLVQLGWTPPAEEA